MLLFFRSCVNSYENNNNNNNNKYKTMTSRSRGSNPIEVLTFSGFYICNCINCVHKCEDHTLLNNNNNLI